MFDNDGAQRMQNPERRASQVAREVMKPFRAKMARFNDALVQIMVLKSRAERRTASSEVWQRKAIDLVAAVTEERAVFLDAVGKLPADIAAAPAVVNIDLAMERLLANLGALEPVRRQLASQSGAAR